MSARTVNILFSSVGRRVELLRAFRRAYQALEIDGHIVALDMTPLAPALQVADRPYLVPCLDDPTFIPTLVEICRREHVDVVFPLIDLDIALLARQRAAIEALGTRLAVVSRDAAMIAQDKWLTYQFFRSLHIATPCSWLPDQLDEAQVTYPLFIKPRRGSAAEHTFKVLNHEQLAFFTRYVRDPIIQEYLPGPEMTNDVTCDLDGHVMSVVSRQRLEVRGGEVAKGVTVYDPAVCDTCVQVAHALPAVGPITVQCLMKAGVPHFTEINARLGGGVPLGIAAGVDAPRLLLSRVAGLPVHLPPLGSYRTGLYLTRFDDSFFLDRAEYDYLASHHI